MGKNGSKWRHGYIPLNAAAALLKAHGSKRGAARVLGHRSTSAITRHVNSRRQLSASARRRRRR